MTNNSGPYKYAAKLIRDIYLLLIASGVILVSLLASNYSHVKGELYGLTIHSKSLSLVLEYLRRNDLIHSIEDRRDYRIDNSSLLSDFIRRHDEYTRLFERAKIDLGSISQESAAHTLDICNIENTHENQVIISEWASQAASIIHKLESTTAIPSIGSSSASSIRSLRVIRDLAAVPDNLIKDMNSLMQLTSSHGASWYCEEVAWSNILDIKRHLHSSRSDSEYMDFVKAISNFADPNLVDTEASKIEQIHKEVGLKLANSLDRIAGKNPITVPGMGSIQVPIESALQLYPMAVSIGIMFCIAILRRISKPLSQLYENSPDDFHGSLAIPPMPDQTILPFHGLLSIGFLLLPALLTVVLNQQLRLLQETIQKIAAVTNYNVETSFLSWFMDSIAAQSTSQFLVYLSSVLCLGLTGIIHINRFRCTKIKK